MFNVDGASGVNRDMTRESLEIMLRLWSDEGPFEHKGRFWTVRKPEPIPEQYLGAHLKPLQRPHPPIGIAGVSKNSETLKLAGERGFMPMSVNLNPSFVASHWEAVEEGAARSGRTALRSDWRLVREVLIADTDAEAMRLAVDGPMGRMMGEYYIPFLKRAKILDFVKHDPSVSDSDVTPAYCAKHNWVVGTVDTVAEKLEHIYHDVGGFGTCLVYGFDYADTPEIWHNSLTRLAKDVAPRLAHMKPDKVCAQLLRLCQYGGAGCEKEPRTVYIGGPVTEVELRRRQASIPMGFSTVCLNTRMSSAPMAPSIAR